MSTAGIDAATANLNRTAQLHAMRALHLATAKLYSARLAADKAGETQARKDVDRAYFEMQQRCDR